ncbi:MAG: hypothetical protein J0665_19055 [Deltaproteobacteria bacterium]|nr:hypothetical protein [Deltaproteobacteria bacterium]
MFLRLFLIFAIIPIIEIWLLRTAGRVTGCSAGLSAASFDLSPSRLSGSQISNDYPLLLKM